MATELKSTDIVNDLEKFMSAIKPVLKYLGKVYLSSPGDHARGIVVTEDETYSLAFVTTGIVILEKNGNKMNKTMHVHIASLSSETVDKMKPNHPELFNIKSIRRVLIDLVEARKKKLLNRATSMSNAANSLMLEK